MFVSFQNRNYLAFSKYITRVITSFEYMFLVSFILTFVYQYGLIFIKFEIRIILSCKFWLKVN